MNLAHFSVTRPVAVTMRGAAAQREAAATLDLLPKVTVPTVAVITTWASGERREVRSESRRTASRLSRRRRTFTR